MSEKKENVVPLRKLNYKRCTYSDQESRREAALLRQKSARRDLASHARSLAFAKEESFVEEENMIPEDNCSMQTELSGHSRKKSREDRLIASRTYFSKQLMTPEWMVDVPRSFKADIVKGGEDGEDGWLVIPRPEGKRCLVISSRGQTIARLQSGCILKTFPSDLPNGRRRHCSGSDVYCILDCIFHEPDNTYYVVDMMSWKGYSLYDCNAEFRFNWLLSKLQETNLDIVSSKNPYRFLPLPFYECDREGIEAAYKGNFPFLKDGLLFFNKMGHYVIGLTPLVLTWKDADCSRYFVFSDQQTVVLTMLEDDGICYTLENIPLHRLSTEELQMYEINPGDLLRFSIDGAGMDLEGTPYIVNAQYQKRCSIKRGLADSWSKVLFQCAARNGGLTIRKILDAVE